MSPRISETGLGAPPARLDPRARVLYVLVVCAFVFAFKSPRVVGGICILQAVLWLASGLGAAQLLTQGRKLLGFSLFVLVSYGFFAESPRVDHWVRYATLFGRDFHLNVGGLLVGSRMLLKVYALVLASAVARGRDPRALAQGLLALRVPTLFASILDATLFMLGETSFGRRRSGGGGGGGGGGGRRRREEAAVREAEGDTARQPGLLAKLKSFFSKDLILRTIREQTDLAERHLAEHSPLPMTKVPEAALVAGIASAMLKIKAIKVLPSVPFAPGYKFVVLSPLYVIAARGTKTVRGASLAGLTMGTVAFILGDGKYGPFEVLKHVAPGVVCDVWLGRRQRVGRFESLLLGGVMGLGRFTTIASVTLLADPPAAAWGLLLPALAIHTGFGLVSGWVSHPFLLQSQTESLHPETALGNLKAKEEDPS